MHTAVWRLLRNNTAACLQHFSDGVPEKSPYQPHSTEVRAESEHTTYISTYTAKHIAELSHGAILSKETAMRHVRDKFKQRTRHCKSNAFAALSLMVRMFRPPGANNRSIMQWSLNRKDHLIKSKPA